jgi:cytochrome c peroxidase
MRSEMAVLTVLIVIALSAGTVSSAKTGGAASIDRGKVLFSDPRLGTNGRSCNDCHSNGKGMDRVANSPDLPGMVNGCITTALKGAALDERSTEMESLLLYIRSFGKQGR